jgi:hypothetical protein
MDQHILEVTAAYYNMKMLASQPLLVVQPCHPMYRDSYMINWHRIKAEYD